MTAMQDRQRSDKRAGEARPAIRRPKAVDPPKRRPVLLAVSALAVLLWTLFLVWMAWS
jgi:hypothetical protein